MRSTRWFLVLVLVLVGCSSSDGNLGGDGGSGGDLGGGADSTEGGGSSAGTCMDILSCIAVCPDSDVTCPDVCHAAGSTTGKGQLLALLQCMDQHQCADVACIESQCSSELVTCLSSSTTGGGNPNPDAGVPAGSIPQALVGHWVRPGTTNIADFTFNANGSAMHTKYKESSLGSCDMSVNSEWKTGSVIASGDKPKVTLATGVTTVVWVGGCGSSYQNPAPGKLLELVYQLDLSGSNPGIWLTDRSCTGGNCKDFYLKK